MTPELKAKIDAAKARAQKTLAAAKEQQNVEQQEAPKVKTLSQSTGSGETDSVVGQLALQSASVTTEVHVVSTDGLQPAALVVVERVVENERQIHEHSEPATELDTNNPIHQGFLQRLEDLTTALLARDPMMPTHLAEIHKTLMQYDDIMPLLTVEEISKIMAAQQTHVALFLRQEVVKSSKAAAAKKTAKVTLDDI